MVTEYIEIYVIRTDLDEVVENIYPSLLMTVIVIKIGTYVFCQNRWNLLLQYVTEAYEYEREHADKIKGKIIHRYTTYCRQLLLLGPSILNRRYNVYCDSFEKRDRTLSSHI